jgi:hypothetical protein
MPLTRKIITKATTAPETRRVWVPPSQEKMKLLRADFDRLANSDKAAFMRAGGTIVNTAAEANISLPASLAAAAKVQPAPRRPSYYQR